MLNNVKPCDPNDCVVTKQFDPKEWPTAQQKKHAERLYIDHEWTLEHIAKEIGKSLGTVSNWLSFLETEKLKPRISKRGRKGEGRPKGSGKKPRKAPARSAKVDQIVGAAEVLDSIAEVATAANVSPRTARRELETEAIKREAEAQIDPATLSLTAQQKLDTAIRQHQRKLSIEFEARVAEEVKRRMETALPHLKAKQAHADKISASYTPRFSKKDCHDVARCLHSDTWQALNVPPELTARLKTAFIHFRKMQEFLCVE